MLFTCAELDTNFSWLEWITHFCRIKLLSASDMLINSYSSKHNLFNIIFKWIRLGTCKMPCLNQLSNFSHIFDWISWIFELAFNWNMLHLIDLDIVFYMHFGPYWLNPTSSFLFLVLYYPLFVFPLGVYSPLVSLSLVIFHSKTHWQERTFLVGV